MKQIVQNLSNGETEIKQVPYPACPPRHVTVRAVRSLISLGTERMLVDFARGSLLNKARQQPEKVRMVMDKARSDGVVATVEAVRSKLAQPLAMGYCSAGVVLESVESEFSPGERVVSNGPHAEVVCVPRNLVARVPDAVSFEEAAFTPVAAIGLQGVRLIEPQLGETVVVVGLGLIGLLCVQLLRSHGCRVIGIDPDPKKVALAESFGAAPVLLADGVDPVREVLGRCDTDGVDAVLIAASTRSPEPMRQAARMCRKRGRIVLVGVVGLELDRSDFYEKELTFQVSCSYGPGRYDPFYEERGNDYPIGFVRWTEKRNFDAVLALMADGKLDVKPLISKTFGIDEVHDAYDSITSDRSALGIVIDYGEEESEGLRARSVTVAPGPADATGASRDSVGVGFIGAGNYASRVLVPAFKDGGARLRQIVSQGGMSAAHHGSVNGFEFAGTDVEALLRDDAVDVVVVATRHDTHAEFTVRALEAGKQVFVEKPLALDEASLQAISDAVVARGSRDMNPVMVGFNRRFAPHVITMKEALSRLTEPKCFVFVMNAGHIPSDSWLQSREKGGGRVIGEACHLIDLMRHLAGSAITSVEARSVGRSDALETLEDKCIITLGFEDGSIGSVHYLANGGSRFPKERLEVFAGDAVLQIDNYRALRSFGWKGVRPRRSLRQDKGQRECVTRYVESVLAGRGAPIPFEELREVSRASLEADRQIRGKL